MRSAPLFAAVLLAGLAPVAGAAEPAAKTPQAAPGPFSGPSLEESELGSIAGREDTTQIARNDQVAGVSRSSVGDNSVTGEARIDGNAFQNLSGLSILNVNTGNNVAINAAMNVNISITPGQ